MNLACSFFHLNYLGWLAGLGVLVPLSFCTAAGICVGCVSGCGLGGLKIHTLLALVTHIARLAAESLGCTPSWQRASSGPVPLPAHQQGTVCLWLYFLVFSQNPVLPQPRDGGTRGPLWALRAASFPPWSQLQPFPPRGWTSGPDVSGESVGVGCGQPRGEEEGARQLAGPALAGERV